MRTTSPVAPPGPPRLLRRQGRQGPPRLLRSQSQSRSSRSQSQSQSEGRQRLTPKLAQGVIIDMVRSLAPMLGPKG